MIKKKLIRITTVPISLDKLLGKQLSFMNQFYEVTAISADQKELQRVAKKYGVKNYHVQMTRQISPLQDLLALWKLYQFLRREKPQIVHTHTPKAGIVGMMAAFFAGVPHRFHTVAGLPLMEAEGLKRKILNAVESLTYRFATKVYPNSFGLQDIILKEGFCSPEKLKVLGKGSSNGIDTSHFNRDQISMEKQEQLQLTLGIQPEDFVFIFVGRLVSDKGVNELVQAFKNIQRNGDAATPSPTHRLPHPAPHNLKLLLVGPKESDLDALLPETLKEIEENTSIITAGYQDDVRPYFALAHALAFPSYREGFPNVVLQAGAMELPSIVSNINGCNEIIKEGENGLIIPVKNTSELQKAMRKLLTDEPLYDHLKKNARTRIVQNYEQEVVWQALLEEYRKAEKHV